MPLLSPAGRAKLLDMSVGMANPVAGIPTSFWLTLFYSDPSVETSPVDVELERDVGGYRREEIPNDDANWAAANISGENVEKRTIEIYDMPISTAAWSHTVTHAGLMDVDQGSGELWDYTQLAAPVTVASSGLTISFPAGSVVIRHL